MTLATAARHKEIEQRLCSLFGVEKLACFLFVGQEEAGPTYWFRLPSVKGNRLARIDDLGNLHIYLINCSLVQVETGEVVGN